MDETVSAAEASRSFSRLLRALGEGRSSIVTSDDRPVARIVPCEDEAAPREEWRRNREALTARLRAQPASEPPPGQRWARAAL